MVLRSGYVYAADTAGGVLVLNALTGKAVQWLLPRSRIVADMHSNTTGLYVVSETGTVYGFKTIPKTKEAIFQEVSRGFMSWDGQ